MIAQNKRAVENYKIKLVIAQSQMGNLEEGFSRQLDCKFGRATCKPNTKKIHSYIQMMVTVRLLDKNRYIQNMVTVRLFDIRKGA